MLILSSDQNLFLLHCGGHVSSTALAFPFDRLRYLCVYIFIAIKYNYGILVLSCYIFCVLVADVSICRTASSRPCMGCAPPSRTYRMPLSGISARTPLSQIFYIASASAGLSVSWSKRGAQLILQHELSCTSMSCADRA